MRHMNRVIALLVVWFCGIALKAQVVEVDSITCVNWEADTIIFNNADWSPIFDRMAQLQDTAHNEPNIISIVHLGDSHVQAGYFSEALRLALQERWGNAGRGLIAPLRICKTNEPAAYKKTSTN